MVEGSGTLVVSGDGSAGGPCSATFGGETLATVVGNRNAALSYHLNIVTQQNAMMTTVCPGIPPVQTPLVGEDILTEVILSVANGFTENREMEVDEGTYQIEIMLHHPYTVLPDE